MAGVLVELAVAQLRKATRAIVNLSGLGLTCTVALAIHPRPLVLRPVWPVEMACEAGTPEIPELLSGGFVFLIFIFDRLRKN